MYIHAEGEKKERHRPGIGALFERLSLEHLISKQKVTHVGTFDALKKSVYASGNPKAIRELPLEFSLIATEAREAQLERKRVKPRKIYRAAAWTSLLDNARQHSLRQTTKATARNRREA